MKIAVLQFDPKLGQRDANIAHANEILAGSDVAGIDLLVLPEMAFTGYPERSTAELKKNFNSMVTADPEGNVVVNYRKSFLFETDESWAEEGPGFLLTDLPGLNQSTSGAQDGILTPPGKVAMGICMDLSPYKFEAPFNKFEFGNHVVNGSASLVITCMAWLTHASVEEVTSKKATPAFDTVSYWALRLTPLVNKEDDTETVVVFANRCGVEVGTVKATEGVSLERNGEGEQLIRYAGSSCVMGFKAGNVRVWDVLGRGEESVLIVDTSQPSKYALVNREQQETGD